jgi:uncharacterized protein HemX
LQQNSKIAREAREKADAATESLFANNEQARAMWEGKLKDIQAQADRHEQQVKEKDKVIADMRQQMQSLSVKNETTIREKDSHLREAREKIEQLQLDTFANDNASRTFEQKSKEFL